MIAARITQKRLFRRAAKHRQLLPADPGSLFQRTEPFRERIPNAVRRRNPKPRAGILNYAEKRARPAPPLAEPTAPLRARREPVTITPPTAPPAIRAKILSQAVHVNPPSIKVKFNQTTSTAQKSHSALHRQPPRRMQTARNRSRSRKHCRNLKPRTANSRLPSAARKASAPSPQPQLSPPTSDRAPPTQTTIAPLAKRARHHRPAAYFPRRFSFKNASISARIAPFELMRAAQRSAASCHSGRQSQ